MNCKPSPNAGWSVTTPPSKVLNTTPACPALIVTKVLPPSNKSKPKMIIIGNPIFGKFFIFLCFKLLKLLLFKLLNYYLC